MTTMIRACTSDGEYGRCDAKCYNAKGSKCTCICGGANHGAGCNKAIENTTEMAERWIEEYRNAHPDIKIDFEIPNRQLELISGVEHGES